MVNAFNGNLRLFSLFARGLLMLVKIWIEREGTMIARQEIASKIFIHKNAQDVNVAS